MYKIHRVNENTIDLSELRNMLKAGDKFLCERCNSELIIALNLDDSKKLGITPGIYCPKDTSHIYIHIYLKEARDRMHALFNKIDADRKNDKNK
jgi:hypothetical protein